MQLIFLDTETTGIQNSDDCIIQLAYKQPGLEAVNLFFKPLRPVCFEAMAVHNITNEMLEDKTYLGEHPVKQELGELLKQNYLVAHNADFDIGALMKEGIFPRRFICTLKVARRYLETDINGQDLSGYSIQYLRYALGINDDSFIAHDALSDILLLERLFYYLYDKVAEILGTQDCDAILEHMYEISSQPSLLKKIKFGKFSGQSFEAIAKQDIGYLEWLISKPDIDPDLRFTLDYHIKVYRGVATQTVTITAGRN
jgi:exodeoxyribonuclease X